ncbi:MAG TPA: SusE domain-containing protein [Haliscomenobacter sp.]|uniref:SusE domain-containing protein n=1 Tax=Haliscomenobacter sp. TaxID=2717303 RepID=UPI002C086537|nr:SusE domain-containing protein [Haliscomenobacter sp.]HOY18071.1 SusE domain-containing protein [Haliscomenobacter sp.]
MKTYLRFISIFFLAGLALNSCSKEEIDSVFKDGVAPTLSSSVNRVNLVPADSSRNVISFNWSDPNYQIDGEKTSHNVTYTLEIDSLGKNFAKPQRITVTNALSNPINGKEFNRMLANLNIADSARNYSLAIRVKAALYLPSTELISNTINLTVSPYSTEPVALYPVPDNLFLVGDATVGGWNNPVPTPGQKFTKLDKFTFGGVFQLTGGNKYLFLPTNGDWGHKYAIANAGAAGMREGGDFIVDSGQDIPAPLASGNYKIIVDFVKGKYTVTPVSNADMPPSNLFIVGDATNGGWNNPVPVPTQQFTQVSSGAFELNVALSSGKKYLLLPQNGSWDHKFAIANADAPSVKLGGKFVADSGVDIPAPDEAGTYRISVEFINKTYKLTKL